MPEQFGEKTEAPTQRRRQEARDEGNVARSSDLSGAMVLLGSVLLLTMFGSQMLAAMKVLVESMLTGRGAADVVRTGDIGRLMHEALMLSGKILLPVALGVMFIAIVAGIVQVGFLVTGKPLVPKLSKLSPVKGLKQIFSARGAVRLLMSLGKVAAVLAVAWISIHQDMPKILALIHLEAGPLLAAAASLVWALAMKIVLLLLLLAVLDYFYQKWQHEQDLKMTRHEVKEEFKRMEGDPLVKQRRAKVARQLALQRLAHDVPKADVVVANPTHFAVAMQYEGQSMNAPKVVAKGADFLAMRIRQIAAANGIPVVERPPLARALYRAVEVGQEIPQQFYAAVAEIMAYVYRLSGKKSA